MLLMMIWLHIKLNLKKHHRKRKPCAGFSEFFFTRQGEPTYIIVSETTLKKSNKVTKIYKKKSVQV